MGNTQKMERQIYATDGEYFLYPITEEDHEDFVNLQIQTQGNTTLFLNPHFKDIIWNQVLQGKDKTFSIQALASTLLPKNSCIRATILFKSSV